MAGSTPPVETPKLGMKATIAGLVFALAVLAGFGVATAASYEDSVSHDDDSVDYDDSDGHSDDEPDEPSDE